MKRWKYRGYKEPAAAGSGRLTKGTTNVAETGTAACKSRVVLTIRDNSLSASYRRCHDEETKSVFDPSVRRTGPPIGGICRQSPVGHQVSDRVNPERIRCIPVPKGMTVRTAGGRADHLKHHGYLQ